MNQWGFYIGLSHEQGEFIYQAAFVAAIAVRSWIFLQTCAGKGLPLSAASEIMGFSFLSFLLATRLSTLSADGWVTWLNHGIFTSGRSVAGGLLFGLGGFLLASWWYRARWCRIDLLAVAVPLALAVQRLGCLAVGCCFGQSQTGWPGVIYPACSPAGHSQIDLGLLSMQDTWSLAVVPVPLLLIAGYVGIAVLMHFMYRHGSKIHRPVFLGLTLFFVLHFLVDFVRVGFNQTAFGEEVVGLKKIQWAEAILALTFLVFYLKKTGVTDLTAVNVPRYRRIVLIGFCTVAVFLFRSAWNKEDWYALGVNALPFVLFSVLPFAQLRFRWYRIALASLFVLYLKQGFPLIAQIHPHANLWALPDTGRYIYNQFSAGMGSETLEHYHAHKSVYSSGCGTPGWHTVGDGPIYQNRIKTGAFNYGRVLQYGNYRKQEWIFGANLGKVTEFEGDTNAGKYVFMQNRSVPPRIDWIGGVSGMYRYDGKWLGAGLGFQSGMYHPSHRIYENTAEGKKYPTFRIVPLYSFRLGNPRWFYYYLQSNGDFERNLSFHRAMFLSEMGIGTGMGLRNGSYLRLGLQVADENNTSAVVDLRLNFQQQFGVSFKFSADNTSERYFASGGVIYRLGFRPVSVQNQSVEYRMYHFDIAPRK
ncbi:MAG: prolipoprotein diacylglyceryl transferase [Bacteroidetes bacterium]|nr:prolipoprotein diacylglyceryl transferase [Bacteroidota bacterium]